MLMIPLGGGSLKVGVPKGRICGYTLLVTVGVCKAKVGVTF
jgi:hypothetical protein